MKRSVKFNALTLLLGAAWLMSACQLTSLSGGLGSGNAPAPTSATQAVEPPTPEIEATKAQTESAPVTPEPTAIFQPISKSAPDCEYGGQFAAIEAVDRLTVRFRLCQPEVAFLSKIAYPAFGILPAEFLEAAGGGGKGSRLLEAPVGTGPYRVARWDPGEELVFSAFEGYWGEKARIGELVFRWELDASQRLLELQAGTVQAIDNPSSGDLDAIQSSPDLALIERSPLSVAYLGMNNTYPPFDNQIVRQAINLALDRTALLQAAFPPGFVLAEYFTPCAIPLGCLGEKWYGYDPVQARQLLDQADFPSGFQTQIAYRDVVRSYMPQPGLVAEQIRVQLRQNLQINASLIAIDSPDFLQAVDEGRLPGLFLLGWGADYADVTNFLDTHFGAQATRLFGKPFPDIQSALELGGSIAAEAERKPYYETANNAIREHAPLAPLAHGGWLDAQALSIAVNRSVQGASASPFSLERFNEMSVNGQARLVWMQSLEPLSLYCADETDSDSLRACAQVIEPLYRFARGGANLEPALAESCTPNAELTEWTCKLRDGVQFHDGSLLDAADVVRSFSVQWDAADGLHKGRTGEFAYFKELWGAFLNAR
ncbi:MAG: hypothetical protein B6D39_08735 [Anaerolineae bacterium UTCFX2]|jgi:ABC-type transport system substrate-binding protein|nr:ABC transporter substrate-binding protein [Anaerolineales bacterium]OQY90041.1 MAG: hypothetical protein B6D39_08735 [Anaerolineae bacterium UTCFX2]